MTHLQQRHSPFSIVIGIILQQARIHAKTLQRISALVNAKKQQTSATLLDKIFAA